MNALHRTIILFALLAPIAVAGQAPGKIRKSDRDGDGIKNKWDKCPDEAGPVYLFGCPDRDGDGVIDSKDLCPDQPGLEYLQGCPDRDADGISDLFDECPDTPGLPERKGCPDADMDGIVDDLDQCPTEPGSEKTFGCPDRDDDGVADRDDDCPDQPGDASANGCPDSDGDGIADNLDKCPNTPGLAELNGCPELQAADREFLYRSRERLKFQPGSALLTEDGRAYIGELAALLARYPDFDVEISVHIDLQGDAEAGQKLSEAQADLCAKLLAQKGVAPGRIKARGFGGTTPVASNRYPEGREKNRRVEVRVGN